MRDLGSNRLRPGHLLQAGRLLLLALALAFAAAQSRADEIVVHELKPASFADARVALLDALIDEGLAPPAVSQFGAMLRRSAADLGYPPELYDNAEIFSFCSVKISSQLVQEDRRHIALCPLTIAVYALPERPGLVFLAYRPPTLTSPAATQARELLDRLAIRARRNLGLAD